MPAFAGRTLLGTNLVCCPNRLLILWQDRLVPSLPETLMVLSAIPCSLFRAQYETLLHSCDGDEAIPPFSHLGLELPFQFVLVKENRQAMCSLRCRGTNPGQ